MSGNLRSTQYAGIKIAYQEFGSGQEALVFIHGWTCASSLWKYQDPLFHQFRTLLIDLPGHGESEAPVVEYSHEYFARAIKAVFDNAAIEKAVLVAHSMGGPVSTTFLRIFPNHVSAIIYVDSFFNLPENYLTRVQRKEHSKKMEDIDAFKDLLNIFWNPRTTQAIQDEIIGTMTGTAKHVRINATTTDNLPPAFRWDEVYHIPAVHFVTPMFANIDRHWSHHLPKLKTEEWSDYGHFLFMEDPGRFNQAVLDFLSNNKLLM